MKIRGTAATFQTPDGSTFTLDACDVSLLQGRKWYNLAGYAGDSNESPYARLHRLIMEKLIGRPLQQGEYVDHINRDTHDNRRSNLRRSTMAENMRNKSISRRNTTGYIGVSRAPKSDKYRASIGIDSMLLHLGVFDTAIEAAYVRDQFALALHGDFASLNVL